jgi:hypothetical protein
MTEHGIIPRYFSQSQPETYRIESAKNAAAARMIRSVTTASRRESCSSRAQAIP